MPLFTYSRDIPDAPNNPSVDQPLMKTNTNSADSLIDIDHFSFNQNAGGLHKQTTFVQQTAPGFPNGGDGLWFGGANSGNTWPHWQNSLGTVLLCNGVPSAANPGYTYVTGGIIFQWGTVSPVVNQTLTAVNFPLNPFPNNCFVVLATPRRTASPNNVDQIYINATSVNSFSYYATTSGAGFASFDWIAIGN